MTSPEETTIFFWIVLDQRLDELYYEASEMFKRLGVELLPVRPDQISRLLALTESAHVVVICSTRRQAEFAPFLRHVAPHLPVLLRQERLSFFHLSSYDRLQIGARQRLKHYFFFKYPLKLAPLCAKLVKFHQLRANETQKWPGGRRAKVPGLAS
jgi:hypothetical protein